MKLNPDCIRDILLCVEEKGFDKSIQFSEIIASLNQYEEETILYHIRQCDCNKFFTKVSYYECGKVGIIFDLTPKAHEFLANIRSDTMWSKIKDKALKFGDISLPILQQAAAILIKDFIKK